MTNVRALGYGALVAVVVFYYLAVPLLSDLFGPVAALPAYAAVALLAGMATYHVVRFLSARVWTSAEEPANADAEGEAADEEVDAEFEEMEIEKMLGELETDRGE